MDRGSVSVPLRGCGFEILYHGTSFVYFQWDVSVPLRGCGFEIIKMHLYFTTNTEVSVPLRGCGFEILASESLVPHGSEWRFAARIG